MLLAFSWESMCLQKWSAKKKKEGEGEQRGAVRPVHLRQAAVRGTQVQADHTFRPL